MIKPISDYDGYFISDDGKVYCNLGRGNRHAEQSKRVPLYEIKPRYTRHGYARVYMRQTSSGKRKDYYIHRLVAEYFLDNPLHKNYVNHKNYHRNDNRAENLQWVTASENTGYTIQMNHIIRDQLGRYVSNFDYQTV